MKYDVIIIGAGPSGIFCAYELLKEKNANEKESEIISLSFVISNNHRLLFVYHIL